MQRFVITLVIVAVSGLLLVAVAAADSGQTTVDAYGTQAGRTAGALNSSAGETSATGASDELPFTGQNLVVAGAVGLGLIGAGALLRRRRDGSEG